MHHLATAFRLLRKPECNIAASLSLDDAKAMRATVVSMVLATDLALNFTVINSFKTMLEPADAPAAVGGGAAPPPLPLPPPRTRNDERFVGGTAPLFSSDPATLSADEKNILLKLAVKCADIGNVTKGKATALAWTERVIKEFFDQGDEERSLGLPVTPMNDRHTANIPKNQLGFYNFIVRRRARELESSSPQRSTQQLSLCCALSAPPHPTRMEPGAANVRRLRPARRSLGAAP